MMYYIGIDLGGINIAVGIVDENCKIICKGSVPTGRLRPFEEIMKDMADLCKKLIAEGKQPQVVLGFNTESEIFLAEEFMALGADVYIATADGSVGTRGFVTDVLQALDYTYF